MHSWHGQSGSPIWLALDKNPKGIVRGLLTHRATDSGDVPGPASQVIIDQAIFNNITCWMKYAASAATTGNCNGI